MRTVLVAIIRWYQRHISPHLGTNCRFKPTCSEYTIDAIHIHGAAKGLLLGIWRFLRCNPFGKVGYDPPPPRGSWRHPQRNIWREKNAKKDK